MLIEKKSTAPNSAKVSIATRDKPATIAGLAAGKIKEYKEKNKEKISERCGVKIMCECGCQIRKDGLKDHLKTKKHKKLMEAK